MLQLEMEEIYNESNTFKIKLVIGDKIFVSCKLLHLGRT